MPKGLRVSVAMLAVVLAIGACSDITAPRLVTAFDWGEVDDPETVVPGITTSVALGELFILGQLNTPTRCYNLEAGFGRSKKKINIRVTAKPNNAPNCDQSLGGFRYTAVVSNLKFDTYDLTVIHDITGGEGGQFTKSITIK